MKRLSLLLILTMLLSACSTPTSTTSPTAAPTSTPTAIPATATATEIAPSMENLPAEWKDKVSGVVTLPDGRIVALEKLTAEEEAAGLKPQLRELQWDDAQGEWIPYVPKVGFVSTDSEGWDKDFNGWTVKSDDMTGPELAAIAVEPIYGVGGQKIQPGLVADFSDYTVFCGDIIEVHSAGTGKGGIMVIRVPLATGDLELFFVPYVVNYGPGWFGSAFNQDSIDPSLLIDPLKFQNKLMREVIIEYQIGSTPKLGRAYQLALAEAAPTRLVFAISKTFPSAGGGDSPEARRQLIVKWMTDDVFDMSKILVQLDNPAMVPEAEYQP